MLPVAILPMYSSNSGRPTVSPESIRHDLVDHPQSLLDYFRAVSYGQLDFEVWAAPQWHDAGDAVHTMDFVRAATTVPGLDLSVYGHLIIVVPAHPEDSPRRFRPMGALHGIELDGHPVRAGVSIIEDGSLAVLPPGTGEDRYAGALRHELVHAWFDLGHTGRLICTDDDGARVPYHPVHRRVEIGGTKVGGITMGTGRHFDVVQTVEAGFWRPDEPVVQTVHGSGTTEIDLIALSAPDDGVRTIRVPIDPDGARPRHLWLEYRRPLGYDAHLFAHPWSGLPGGQVMGLDGVLVYTEGEPFRGHGVLSSLLLDMTPGEEGPRDDWRMCGLGAGRSYTEPVFGRTIDVRETGPTSARVRITG